MSLILPDWVAHVADEDKKKKATIFSLAVHPDGSRLATGGLDSKIRIWATEPILNPIVEKMEGAHKLLSTLERHSGSVLVVRWSHSGRFLASGSDDRIALIWDLDISGSGGGGSFGSSTPNIEHWRPHRRLPAHESDVVDIAWSADDDYVATVGLDSIIYIWSGHNFEKIRRLDGHDGFVKGVVWDPLGQYLASQSDDKSLIVWRTTDWGIETIITEPFEGSPGSTFFRRPSWSPDGGVILASNAMSGPIFTARMIERSSWKADQNLVGHENSVAVAAYSPAAFKAEAGAIGKISTVFALGSLDQSVSIWKEGKGEPLLVAQDLFERGVMDLSWSSDGTTLYACSADGAVAVFSFDSNVLGQVADASELKAAQKRFGVTKPIVHTFMQQPPQQRFPPQGQMYPNPMMQMPYGQPQMNGIYPPQFPMGMSPYGFPQAYPGMPPQFLPQIQPQLGSMPPPPPPSFAPAPAPAPKSSLGTKDRPNMLQPKRPGDSSRQATPSSSQPGVSLSSARGPGDRLNQNITRTKDGKRRIRPTQLSGGSEAGSERNTSMPPQAQAQAQAHGPQSHQPQAGYIPSQMNQMSIYAQPQQNGHQNDYSQQPDVYSHYQAPYNPNVARQLGSVPGVIGSRINPILESQAPRGHKRKASQVDERSILRLAQAKGRDIKSSIRDRGEAPVNAEVVSKLLDNDYYAVSLPLVKSFNMVDGPHGFLEARNLGNDLPTEIRLYDTNDAETDSVIWNDFSPVPCLLLTTTPSFSAVALEDSSLVVYTPSGRCSHRLTLDSPCARLDSNGDFLIAISASGTLYRWNAVSQAQLSAPISILPILSSGSLSQRHRLGEGENLLALKVHTNGLPILFTKSEMAFTFDSKSQSLTCISQGWFIDYSDLERPPSDESSPVLSIESEIARLVQARNITGIRPASVAPESRDSFRKAVTIKHAETRLRAACLLESRNEYKVFLLIYVTHLSRQGLATQARELCQELLGPAFRRPSDTWEPTVLGIHKHSLLSPVVQSLANSPSQEVRSVAAPFQEILLALSST